MLVCERRCLLSSTKPRASGSPPPRVLSRTGEARRRQIRGYGTFEYSRRFPREVGQERGNVMLFTILIIILILLLIGALPAWHYSTGWGYYSGGGVGLLLIIVIILALPGRF